MTVVDAVRILVNGGMRGVVSVIAGNNGSDADHVRAMAERIEAQGIGGLVRRVGHCADMPAAYAIADFVVIPAAEPTTFDVMAVEAQAMARPVITRRSARLPSSCWRRHACPRWSEPGGSPAPPTRLRSPARSRRRSPSTCKPGT